MFGLERFRQDRKIDKEEQPTTVVGNGNKDIDKVLVELDSTNQPKIEETPNVGRR